MLLQIIIPIVIYVVTNSFGQSVEHGRDVSGVHTNLEVEKKQEDAEELDKQEKAKEDAGSQKDEQINNDTSVQIQDGESSVHVTIDNNTSQNSSEDKVTTSLSEYVYPGTSASEDSSTVTMDSGDNPSTVTDWYENKIRAKGMSVQSFVRTNSNGNVLNKLGAAGGGENILIEISGHEGTGSTHIVIKRQ